MSMVTENEKIKILIAEDDVFIAESLMLTLQGLGYDVGEPCATPGEALQLLSSQSFDLAILDIQFYGKDEGISLGKIISSQYKIPFIFLTAFSDVNTISNATESGPSAYLIKPASPELLFATIQTALYNFNSHIIATQIDIPEQQLSFFIKLNNTLFRVSWNEVVSIEATKNYALLHLCDSKVPPLPLRGTLQYALKLVPSAVTNSFVQINRGCYLNINFINLLNKDTVTTPVGNYKLGESYKKQLLGKLKIH